MTRDHLKLSLVDGGSYFSLGCLVSMVKIHSFLRLLTADVEFLVFLLRLFGQHGKNPFFLRLLTADVEFVGVRLVLIRESVKTVDSQ